MKAILEEGAPGNRQRLRQRHLLQETMENSYLLRMTPASFSPSWLEYDLYARWYIKGFELSLDIPDGLTATLSYGVFSAVLTGEATRPIELAYGGTLVQVLLKDPAYSGESTVYELHAHRELPPDAPTLSALSAEVIGGNAKIRFQAVRESTFNELASATGGEDVTKQPASHYTLEVINPEQLAAEEDIFVLYTFNPSPVWAESLMVTWEPRASAVSLSGADSAVFEPPRGNVSVIYAASATTVLLFQAGSSTYSYAIQVDLGARWQNVSSESGDTGSNQNGTSGLGGLDDDSVITTHRLPPPPAGEEDTSRPWWFLALLVGAVALLFAAACWAFLACARRRKRERRAITINEASRQQSNSAHSEMMSQNDLYGGLQPRHLSMTTTNPLASAEALSASTEGEAMKRKTVRPSLGNDSQMMDTWYGMTMKSNPMAEFRSPAHTYIHDGYNTTGSGGASASGSRPSLTDAGDQLWMANVADAYAGDELSPSELGFTGGVIATGDPALAAYGASTSGEARRWKGDAFAANGSSLIVSNAGGESQATRWTENAALATAGGSAEMEEMSMQGLNVLMESGGARLERQHTIVNPLFTSYDVGGDFAQMAGPIVGADPADMSAPPTRPAAGTVWVTPEAQFAAESSMARNAFIGGRADGANAGVGDFALVDDGTGWTEQVTDGGRLFWINTRTGETSRSLPLDLAASRLQCADAMTANLGRIAASLEVESDVRVAMTDVHLQLQAVKAHFQEDLTSLEVGADINYDNDWRARQAAASDALGRVGRTLNMLAGRDSCAELEQLLHSTRAQLRPVAGASSGTTDIARPRGGSTWNAVTGMMEKTNPLYQVT